MTDWNDMTEGQKIVAAFQAGTIDGPETLAASIDTRLDGARAHVKLLEAELEVLRLLKDSRG